MPFRSEVGPAHSLAPTAEMLIALAEMPEATAGTFGGAGDGGSATPDVAASTAAHVYSSAAFTLGMGAATAHALLKSGNSPMTGAICDATIAALISARLTRHRPVVNASCCLAEKYGDREAAAAIKAAATTWGVILV